MASRLDSSRLSFTQARSLRPVPEPGSAEIWSQRTCSDHMLTCRWTAEGGWDAPEIKPFADITISPIASCLHYATQCFEGMKVYRGFDGTLRLFRPRLNARRLALSAKRVALPEFDEPELVQLIKALVSVDGERGVPMEARGHFLYIRPAIIGTGSQIGIQLPREAQLLIICVVWPDFSIESPPGARPQAPGLRLLTSHSTMTRAWPGGFGDVKVGANYGTTFAAHGNALERGFDQVLWLFGPEGQITEAGASNFFVVVRTHPTGKRELLTAPLTDGLILDGVTRRSVLELAHSRLGDELDVCEKSFTMSDLEVAWEKGRLLEAFVSGTAFFITPVSAIHYRGRDLQLPSSGWGAGSSYAGKIKGWLKDIMYGTEDHEWSLVDE